MYELELAHKIFPILKERFKNIQLDDFMSCFKQMSTDLYILNELSFKVLVQHAALPDVSKRTIECLKDIEIWFLWQLLLHRHKLSELRLTKNMTDSLRVALRESYPELW